MTTQDATQLLARHSAGNDVLSQALAMRPETPESALAIASILYTSHPDAALRILLDFPTAQCTGLTIQLYLSLHRADLAQRTLSVFKQQCEDPVLVLYEAWIALATSDPQAYYILQELLATDGPIGSVLKGLGVAQLGRGFVPEARALFMEALVKVSGI